MADNEKEIIKKIEAEALEVKPIVTEVLSSKRSAFINNKARLGGRGCGLSNCGVIVVGYPTGTTAVADQGIFSYDHDNNTYVRIPGPIGNRSDIARWDNKVYLTRPTTIEEWELDYANCTSSLVRIIQISGIPGINIGVGMDMKDANTIIAATSSSSGGTNSVLEIDISSLSNPATVNVLFTVPNAAAGDVIYMQDTGEILISHNNGDLVLYDYNGTAIDSYPHYGGTGMYRNTNGDVFISEYPMNSAVRQITFNPLIIGSTLQNSGLVISGAAYNSNPNAVCDPPSVNCYDIGDIGPEGGIIFSVPGVGLNTSTNVYYEVAQNDIDTATTPSSCFNISCGDEVVTYDVTNGKATHQMLDDNEFTFYWNDTPNPPYPNVGSNPPPQVGDTLTAITPNLFADALGNPISITTILSITPSTHPSGHGAFTVKIADQLTAALDQSGNNTLPFKFSLTTTVVSPCTSPTPVSVTIQPNTISQGTNMINIMYGPTFSLGIGTVSVPWNQSFNFINYAGWEVSGLDDNGNQLFPPNTTITSTTYPTVNNVGPYFTAQMFLSSPSLGNLTPSAVSSITLTGTTGLTPFGLQGSEWGAYDIPHSGPPPTIQTSLDFGLGLDNTDIIHAFPGNPGTPTSGTHPWLNTHDIAATTCKNHGTTNDWFLPSVQEFKEMFTNVGPGSSAANQITFNPLTQKSEHLYWTSSQHIDNGTGLQDPDKYAYAYDTIANNPKLAYRCHALSVRPIRRFECEIPVDEGIDYDYRLSATTAWQARCTYPGVGVICSMVDNTWPILAESTDAYSFNMLQSQNIISGTVIFDVDDLVIAIDSTTVSSLPNIGDSLNNSGGILYSQFGPIVDVIDIATHPQLGIFLSSYQAQAGVAIDTLLVFNQSNMTSFNGPNGSWVGQNYSMFSFIDNINWGSYGPNPNYYPPVFGQTLPHGNCSGIPEIGRQKLYMVLSAWDVRGNNMRDHVSCFSPIPSGCYHNYNGKIFNIKVYDQFEVLLGDWDYQCNFVPNNCGNKRCLYRVNGQLVATNYVNPDEQDPNYPNVVGLANHYNSPDVPTSKGSAYVSFTIKNPVPHTDWNVNMTRGNTLNLEDWIGTGINNRALSPNNPFYTGVSPDWNATYNRFGWGVACQPCGKPNHCSNTWYKEYMAEVPYTTLLQGCGVYQGSLNVEYPSYGVAGITLLGSAWNVPGLCATVPSSKITINNFQPSDKYSDEDNECIEIGSDYEIMLYDPTYTESLNKRQKFVNDKKPKETGPFGINGYYPLYDTVESAVYNSPTPIESRSEEDTYGYHIHEFNGVEYYMPNGLEMGVTQFHGDYDGQIIPETIVEPEVTEDIPEIIETPDIPTVISPPIITEPEEEPEEEPETTYTPPPSPPPSPGGGDSGGY